MDRRYRISSPKIFEAVLTRSENFRDHEWLFDVHPGIVSSFRPDIRIAFISSAARPPNQFGHDAEIARQLVAHPSLLPETGEWSLADLQAQTYVTIAHDDDASLAMFKADERLSPISPSKVFRANDVLAAELAVKLKIGYSALPEFLGRDDVATPAPALSFLDGWSVSPTYLRILSSGTPDIGLSKIHEMLMTALMPFANTPWRAFGQSQNIIPMVSTHE